MGTTTEAPPEAALEPGERCDRCRQAALVLHTKGDMRIALCAHHHRKHDVALVGTGFSLVVDERHTLGGMYAR